MALSALDNKDKNPTRGQLAKVLGRSSGAWDDLVEFVSREFPPIAENWQYSGANWGWSLQLKQKKRAVVYLTPGDGFFYAGFALGERAVKAAHEAMLPAQIMDIIDSAKKYAEGRAFRMEVKYKKDLVGLKKLMKIRMYC